MNDKKYVYILINGFPYEGFDILGVYKTFSKADKELNKIKETRPEDFLNEDYEYIDIIKEILK